MSLLLLTLQLLKSTTFYLNLIGYLCELNLNESLVDLVIIYFKVKRSKSSKRYFHLEKYVI